MRIYIMNYLRGSEVITPSELPGNKPVYHLYVVRVPKRNELQEYLKVHGIFTGIHYPIPLHLQKAMEFLGYKFGDFPVTERITSEILSLPMYAELTDSEIASIVSTVKKF